MGITIGTDSRNNIPLRLRYRYNGADIAWPQPYKINSFSNHSESIDGKYRLSDLDISLIDKDGSYFATNFGNGTLGFGTSLEVIAYLGGTLDLAQHGQATSLALLGSVGAYAATLHTGKVFGVSYAGKVLRIRSKTNLALVNELKWQFPIDETAWDFVYAGYMIGSVGFFPANFSTLYLGSTAFYDFRNKNTEWKCKAYTLSTAYGGNDILSLNYPALAGRGTVAVHPNYYWAGTDSGGTNFYDIYEMQNVEGTFLGTHFGTINSDSDAIDYGYGDRDAAQRARTFGTDGTSSATYVINKTRLRFTGSNIGGFVHFVSRMPISGSPKDCYQLLMTGAMVSPYFTSSDLDTTTLDETGTLTAFSFYSNTIDFDESKVIDSLKEIVDTTQGLFSVNASNKFEYRSYGPKNLRSTIPVFGTAEIIESGFENLEEDFYNRFVVKYDYDFVNNKFATQIEQKTSRWSKASDRPYTIESKWIKNPNEAAVLSQRLRVRYENTLPRVSFKTNLNKIGLDIGTLLKITDPNSGLNGKTVQVVGFDKDWDSKEISFDCLDGESLYQRKGFSVWGTTVTLPGAAISNSSVSGWGTAGTSPNINGSIYGSQFSWW